MYSVLSGSFQFLAAFGDILGMIITLSGWKTQFEVWKETYAKSKSLIGGLLDINFANQVLHSIE